MAGPVILINAFEVPSDQAEQFIAAWEKTRDYLRSQPGYIDTTLHQAPHRGRRFPVRERGREGGSSLAHVLVPAPAGLPGADLVRFGLLGRPRLVGRS
jgi:Antibiotic biosynthesis monooxygenase